MRVSISVRLDLNIGVDIWRRKKMILKTTTTTTVFLNVAKLNIKVYISVILYTTLFSDGDKMLVQAK